jgi:hypothetical protein
VKPSHASARRVVHRNRVAVGDELIFRATEERVRIVAVLDAAGTLLVRSDEAEFQAARDEVEWPWERHASCACCG